jgi:DNA-binding transcriptional regulator YiaG
MLSNVEDWSKNLIGKVGEKTNRDVNIVNLKAIREKVGVSQALFAKALNIYQPQLSHWEKNNYLPLDVAWKIEELFGVDVKEFRVK